MKLLRELDEIYSGLPVGELTCPVCSKSYKKEKTLSVHYDARTCFSMSHVFADTHSEAKMLPIYRALQYMIYGKSASGSLYDMRKSKLYPSIGKFFLFCYGNKIVHMEDYFNYGLGSIKDDGCYTFLSNLTKESTLKEYYNWKRRNVSEEDSLEYCQQYKDIFTEDPSFTLRALEKGNVRLEHLVDIMGEEYFLGLSDIDQARLVAVVE